MSNKPISGKSRIPAKELTAYERWELPAMDEQGNAVKPEPEPEEMVKPLTAADLEQIHKDAYEAGFEEGYKAGEQQGLQNGFEKGHQDGSVKGEQEGYQKGQESGHAEAFAKTDGEMQSALRRLQNLLGELLDPIKAHDDEIEEALLNLTMALTRAVIKRELVLDSRQIRTVLREALGMLPSTSANIRIFLNPVDIDSVSQVINEMDGEAKVIASEEIIPGGCRVETSQSLINYTVEKRFQKAVQSMLERSMARADGEEVSDLSQAMGELTDFHRELLDTEVALDAVEKPISLDPEPEPPEPEPTHVEGSDEPDKN
ncbi:flagellar assembly protein FliH [Oleiphilus messinensis]|uniref:Flagellar assembly protein FliH n=1 Tax=Oleiphilus messinensis TaxID=141451 RepID=A0A1Y0IAR1_9GAMM|nr:flagellar assembly protein FliH [Oleiphilus messinensis]ARU57588.1 flagellar assembly protein FliH [Oleiphilus messinensis]